jgi:ABC-type amino acid transport substrate-binding protein
MRPRIPVLLAAIALFAGSAFAAGCGDDDDNGDTTAGGDLGLIQEGQLDAVIIDQGVAEDAVAAGGVRVATVIPTGEFYGFAVGQDNDALREQMNGALKEMKDDGTLNELYQKYFQQDAPESVLTGTNTDLQ